MRSWGTPLAVCLSWTLACGFSGTGLGSSPRGDDGGADMDAASGDMDATGAGSSGDGSHEAAPSGSSSSSGSGSGGSSSGAQGSSASSSGSSSGGGDGGGDGGLGNCCTICANAMLHTDCVSFNGGSFGSCSGSCQDPQSCQMIGQCNCCGSD